MVQSGKTTISKHLIKDNSNDIVSSRAERLPLCFATAKHPIKTHSKANARVRKTYLIQECGPKVNNLDHLQ